jgi:tetrahydromethanopterin S-methyltransferase subunit F
MIGLRNLVSRNERLSQGNNSVPHGGVALPFILVQVGCFLLP